MNELPITNNCPGHYGIWPCILPKGHAGSCSYWCWPHDGKKRIEPTPPPDDIMERVNEMADRYAKKYGKAIP